MANSKSGNGGNSPARARILERFVVVSERARKEQPDIEAETVAELKQRLDEAQQREKEMETLLSQMDESRSAARAGGEPGPPSSEMEEELRRKDEELNRLKDDFAKKLKNTVALTRIKYEKEIDRLRKQMKEVAEDVDQQDGEARAKAQDLSGWEERLKAKEKELDEARGRAGSEEITAKEQELKQLRIAVEIKSEALKKVEEKLQKREQELNEIRDVLEGELQSRDVDRAQMDSIKKGSVAMMRYITSLQQKKMEEELKDIREALEQEIQKRLEIEEELRVKETELQERRDELRQHIEGKGTGGDALEAIDALERELKVKGAEVREKEERFREKESELLDRIRALDIEIKRKAEEVKAVEGIKKELYSRTEELKALGAAIAKKEAELKAREEAVAKQALMIPTLPPAPPIPVVDTKEVAKKEEELRALRHQLRDRENELKHIMERVRQQEDNIKRWEYELQQREEVMKLEFHKLDEARKNVATVEDMEMKKRLAALEAEVRVKEENMQAREKDLSMKMDDLKVWEARLQGQEVEARVAARKSEFEQEKCRTGTSRLDDLLLGGIPFGGNVLIIGAPFIGKEVLTDMFVIESVMKGVPTIMITTDTAPPEILTEMKLINLDIEKELGKGHLYFIDAYSKSIIGDVQADPYTVLVEHPSDHKGILSAIDDIMKKFRDKGYFKDQKHEHYRMIVRSISTLVTYSDPTATYRFLQTITGKVKRAKGVCFYMLDKGMHKETEIQTLSHVMDGAIEVRTDGIKNFIAVQGICEVATREAVQYKYSPKGLSIGSFTVVHIR